MAPVVTMAPKSIGLVNVLLVEGRSVCTRPPIRLLPSKTMTVYPKNIRCLAQANPETPAPMTIIVLD